MTTEQEIDQLLTEVGLSGDLDQITERIERKLEEIQPTIASVPSSEVAQRIIARFQDRGFDAMPPDLLQSLLDYGYLEYAEDQQLKQRMDDLNQAERDTVDSFNGHMGTATKARLIRSLREGRLLLNERVVAALTWQGLGQLRGLVQEANDAIVAELKAANHASIDALEEQNEELGSAAPYYPEDDDNIEEAQERRPDTEHAVMEAVHFLAHLRSIQNPPRKVPGMKR